MDDSEARERVGAGRGAPRASSRRWPTRRRARRRRRSCRRCSTSTARGWAGSSERVAARRRRPARGGARRRRAGRPPAAPARAASGARRGAGARRAGGGAALPRVPRRQRGAARRSRTASCGLRLAGQLQRLPVVADDAQAGDRGRDPQGRARDRGGERRGALARSRSPALLQLEVLGGPVQAPPRRRRRPELGDGRRPAAADGRRHAGEGGRRRACALPRARTSDVYAYRPDCPGLRGLARGRQR